MVKIVCEKSKSEGLPLAEEARDRRRGLQGVEEEDAAEDG